LYDGVLSKNAVYYSANKKPYFLYAGRFEQVKGILPLIDAYYVYCQTHPSPLPLHIAGGGSDTYTKLVIDKILHYNLEDKIILLGMRSDILSLYREAKALIVPSLNEGFGFITAEALFSGCLVIGNNVAGTKEQFDNGKDKTGMEVALRYNTQDQLVQHLIAGTNNDIEYYEPMILRGQEVAKLLYSTEQSGIELYKFYQQILNK
jgi:glycosyltransferase involved in cell wall biosynthesis